MKHPRPLKSGDHMCICDSCGAQRYRSQCDYTWDGYLMCHVLNCWYPKHPIHEIPPVINDPTPLYDVRPDIASDDSSFVSDAVTRWGFSVLVFGNTIPPRKWGRVDQGPDYI